MTCNVLRLPLGLMLFWTLPAYGGEFRSVTIRIGMQASQAEQNVAHLLANRIAEPGGSATKVEQNAASLPEHAMLILPGVPAHHQELLRQLDTHRALARKGFMSDSLRMPTETRVLRCSPPDVISAACFVVSAHLW